MSGTVNIARDIWHDTAFKDQPFTEREAFVWLIMEASYKAREKRVGNVCVNLSRGQLASSIRFMAEAWDWQKSTVDRFLKRLQSRDMIGTDSGSGLSVITICKYDEYQSKPSDGGTAKKENWDSSGTVAGQQRDKPNKGLIQDEIKMKEEGLGKPNPVPPDNSQACFDHFNAVAAKVGWPVVQKISASRRAALSGRLRDVGGEDGWRAAIDRASLSPLLTGQNGRGWSADFDWLCKPANFTKLMEGNYDPRPANASQATTRRAGDGSATINAFAEVAARYRAEPQ